MKSMYSLIARVFHGVRSGMKPVGPVEYRRMFSDRGICVGAFVHVRGELFIVDGCGVDPVDRKPMLIMKLWEPSGRCRPQPAECRDCGYVVLRDAGA